MLTLTNTYTLILEATVMNKHLFSKTKAIILFILPVALCACAIQANEKEAALLTPNSELARIEIITLISESMGGKKIPIAKDIFQKTSRLLLGKTPVTSPDGINIIRTDNEVAIVFELLKQGDNCLLKRINTSQEWTLTTKSCVKR